jgi:hypothetical protein
MRVRAEEPTLKIAAFARNNVYKLISPKPTAPAENLSAGATICSALPRFFSFKYFRNSAKSRKMPVLMTNIGARQRARRCFFVHQSFREQ